MTQPGAIPTPAAKDTAKKTPSVLVRYGVYLALIALGLLVIAALRSGDLRSPLNGAEGGTKVRLDDLTSRVERLEKTAVVSAVPAIKNENGETTGAEGDAARMKGEISSMETAIGALQSQVKQQTQSSGATLGEAKAQLAMMAAFVQLRAAVDSGGDFSGQLQALKQAAAGNGAAMAAAVQMEPFAADGVASMAALRGEFNALQASAVIEMRKAGAETWKDRLLVELQKIISVRPLKGAAGNEEILENIGGDLDKNRLTAALDKEKGLPEGARKVLKDWRAKAEARQSVNAALAAIAAQFATGVNAKEN